MADGEKRTEEAEDLESLITSVFGERDAFRKSVASVQWKEKSTLCTYDPLTGKTDRRIADADVNPFGWRQKHR